MGVPGSRPGVGVLRRLHVLALAWAALGAALVAPSASSAVEGGDAPPPQLDAASWILLDARDGDRLAAGAPSEPRAIASTTKLMTAYVALSELPLGRKLTVPPYAPAPAESVAGLVAGERLTLRDLLLAMLLPSANDAAETVALGVAPSEEAFVERMNEAAGELGLGGTSYANPIGLDDPLNFSTAADLAQLTLELLDDERFRRIVAKPEATLRSGSLERHVVSRNSLLLTDPSVDGVKTGHTLQAGYVLVASAEREGVPLVSVVLGATSEAERDAESEALLDYGYSLYEPRSPFRAEEVLASVAVRYEDEPLALRAQRKLAVTARADQSLEADVDAPAEIEGPIAAGDRVGSATVILDGEAVGRVPLVAARAIAEPGLVDRLGGPWVVGAIAVAAAVILLGIAMLLRRNRGGRRRRRSPGGEG